MEIDDARTPARGRAKTTKPTPKRKPPITEKDVGRDRVTEFHGDDSADACVLAQSGVRTSI